MEQLAKALFKYNPQGWSTKEQQQQLRYKKNEELYGEYLTDSHGRFLAKQAYMQVMDNSPIAKAIQDNYLSATIDKATNILYKDKGVEMALLCALYRKVLNGQLYQPESHADLEMHDLRIKAIDEELQLRAEQRQRLKRCRAPSPETPPNTPTEEIGIQTTPVKKAKPDTDTLPQCYLQRQPTLQDLTDSGLFEDTDWMDLIPDDIPSVSELFDL